MSVVAGCPSAPSYEGEEGNLIANLAALQRTLTRRFRRAIFAAARSPVDQAARSRCNTRQLCPERLTKKIPQRRALAQFQGTSASFG
jgi:hypothetical protein